MAAYEGVIGELHGNYIVSSRNAALRDGDGAFVVFDNGWSVVAVLDDYTCPITVTYWSVFPGNELVAKASDVSTAFRIGSGLVGYGCSIVQLEVFRLELLCNLLPVFTCGNIDVSKQ